VLVVQVTVRATLWRSIQLTVAVTLGLAASVLLGHVLGLHWWSFGITILGGLVVGELLRLGPFSNQVALSALFALSLGSAYGYQRMIDTALGAGIGVLVNALIAPPTYVQEASRALRRVGDALGALLADIAAGLAMPPEPGIAQRWLTRARRSRIRCRRPTPLSVRAKRACASTTGPAPSSKGCSASVKRSWRSSTLCRRRAAWSARCWR
jgi:uncharacterized membrane protein YgaE (UPF0421/DUF939 family)